MRKARLYRVLCLLIAVVTATVLAMPAVAQQQNERQPAANPLVRLLQSKGILTEEEAALVSQAATPNESERRLAKLLLSKGLITQEDYDQTVGASAIEVAADGTAGARMIPAVLRVPISSPGTATTAAAAPAPQAPKPTPVIPGIAPIRVFPVDPPKREGLIPDLKVGPVRLKPYGFFKASAIRDSSSPEGNDFPLPMFRVDTGRDAAPEFHVKARFFRIGSNFEWVDPSPNLAITGRLEMDFEGNFSRVNNRNISTIRSSAMQIRLAYARIDYAATDHTTLHALFGQDWTPFASSTLPALFETTGLGVGYGTLYERAPQFRAGFTHNFGGSRTFKIQPEVAVVLPAFGNLPGGADAGVALGNQLGFGERQGVDSGRPEIQGRLALQFQLDKAKGVAPAQIIVSGMQGRRSAVVLAAAVPAAFKTPGSPFQFGARAESSRHGFTGEIQLPTRYATIIAKYWNGTDLRFYFGGNFASTYNDVAGLCTVSFTTTCAAAGGVTPAAGVFSVDGSSTVIFGFRGTTPTFAPQRPVRAQGGFVNVGFPLGRIFGANPEGRNAGWQLYLHYGIDLANTRDIKRTAIKTNKGDLAAGTLVYKLNSWVSFVFEESMYRGRVANPLLTTNLFRGIPARSARDLRSEFGTIFSF